MTQRTQEMLRVRANTKDRLRAIAKANRWTMAETAEVAVETLEKNDPRRQQRTARTARA
jgi:hypothetical protein